MHEPAVPATSLEDPRLLRLLVHRLRLPRWGPALRVVALACTLTGCITSSLPWNDERVSPNVHDVAADNTGPKRRILAYGHLHAYRLTEADARPLRYAGPRTVAAVRAAAGARPLEHYEAVVRALPEVDFTPGDEPLVYVDMGAEGPLVHLLSPDLAAKIRAEQEAAAQARAGPEGELREAPVSPTYARIRAEYAAGRIPEGVEVLFLPYRLELTGGEQAQNIAVICAIPFTVLLDIATSPFQLLYFVFISDDPPFQLTHP